MQFGGDDFAIDDISLITVKAVNEAPSFTLKGDQTVAEDAGSQTVSSFLTAASPGPSNESGQTLTLSVSNDNAGLFEEQPAIDLNTGELTYTPGTNANGQATVTVILTDNGSNDAPHENSLTKTFLITIQAVNDKPNFTKGADQTVAEDAGSQTVDGWATDISAGPANESNQTLTFNTSTDNDGLFSV
ncbi:MAG: hypothetical protein HQ515_22170, partial [Phycisphaeraceae bacterium]|nr:hypothetical protein [Phycisphaeraceae bacterium]